MKIDLVIDGEKKTFTAPFVPQLARRKYYELMAKIEDQDPNEQPTPQQILDEEDELNSILSDVVFNRQFTLEQLYAGASKQYADEKLREAIFGKKPKEDEQGNEKGE
jgi:hypothetical protein